MDRLFEESKALLKEIRQVIGRALKDGKMTIHDVDLVVMAGGSQQNAADPEVYPTSVS